ncbi:MAG: hypothetical protein DRG30_06845, partial [Epsilonproteobacteria bacterium]
MRFLNIKTDYRKKIIFNEENQTPLRIRTVKQLNSGEHHVQNNTISYHSSIHHNYSNNATVSISLEDISSKSATNTQKDIQVVPRSKVEEVKMVKPTKPVTPVVVVNVTTPTQ